MSLLDAVQEAIHDVRMLHNLEVERIRIDPSVTQNQIVVQRIARDGYQRRIEILLHPADWNVFLIDERRRLDEQSFSFGGGLADGDVDRLLGIPIYREPPHPSFRFSRQLLDEASEIDGSNYARGVPPIDRVMWESLRERREDR